jgi:hypothetical protein
MPFEDSDRSSTESPIPREPDEARSQDNLHRAHSAVQKSSGDGLADAEVLGHCHCFVGGGGERGPSLRKVVTTQTQIRSRSEIMRTQQPHTMSPRARATGAQATGASSTGAASVGFVAVIAAAAGAAAMGAVAIGALAVGRLRIGDAAVRRLRIGELEVDQLRVRRLQVLERTDGS